jgi:hypothetical protein
MATKITKVARKVMLMPDSAANSDERKRHSAFKRGDVLIFVVLPVVLILGFLVFRWWPKKPADRNLRLVAQVTDDISVELVAVAQYTGQQTPYTKWWKPNGLPAEGIVRDAAGMSLWGDHANDRLFLFRVSDRRPTVGLTLRGLMLTGNIANASTSDDGKTVIVFATVAPTMFSESSCGVTVTSLGQQQVGALTRDTQKLESVVQGQHASIEIGKTTSLVPEGHRKAKSIWTVRITEATLNDGMNSGWRIDARDKTGRSINSFVFTQFLPSPLRHCWQLEGDDWATVTVERTVYDKEVVFGGVSAFEGSFTSPRVDYVGPVRSW